MAVSAETRATLAGTLVVASVSGVRFSFGVFLPELSAGLGQSVSILALAFSLHWAVFTFTAPVAWRVFARIGSRWMFRWGALLCALGFASLAVMPSTLLIVVFYGVLVGVGTHGLGQLAANHPVLVSAEPKRRDRLFGIVACGAPIGTAAYPALAVLLIALIGWQGACFAIAGIVLLAGFVAAALISPEYESRDRPERRVGAAAALGALWRQPAFLLLCGAFFLSLLVQTAVPFLLPVWGASLNFGADQLAFAFVLMGASGVLGRFLMTSERRLFHFRLWIVIPTCLCAVAGFSAAILTSGPLSLYAAVVLLGFSTPVYGALFAIASLACYSAGVFARVSGTLLVPIGLGAALSTFLPGLAVDGGVSFVSIWALLAALVVLLSIFFLFAEYFSPVRRATVAKQPLVSAEI